MPPPAKNDFAFTAERLYGSALENTFSGALSFMRRPYTRDLRGVDVAVTGVPLDTATTNRPGTRFGPRGIRAISTELAWGAPWPWGFDPFDRLAVVDYGDCHFDHGKPWEAPAAIEKHAGEILDAGASMVTLGGDHYISLPLLRAHAARHGKLSLIHFDSHSDTWPQAEESAGRIDHGSMFHHAVNENLVDPAASAQVGIRTHNSERMGFNWLDAAWVLEHGAAATAAEIKRIVGANQAYLTFDIDCLDPAFAPGTGTPVTGGLSTALAQSIIRQLDGIGIVGMDMVEVSPPYDTAEITAMAAASIVLDYLCLRAKDLPERK